MLSGARCDPAERPAWAAPGHRLARGVTAANLATTMMCSSLLLATISALSPLLIGDLGISRTRLGVLLSGYYVTAALTSAPLGRLIDRLGRRAGLTLVLVLAMLASGTAAVSGGQILFGVALLVSGLAVAAANPATNLALAATAPPHGMLMGVKQSGIQLAPIVAGAALVPVATGYGWRVAVGAGAVVAAVVLALVHASPGAMSRRAPTAPAGSPGTGHPPQVRLLAGYAFCMGIGNASVVIYLALFAHEGLSFSEHRAGVLVAVIGAAAVVARIGWSVVVERGRGLLGDERSVLVLISLTAMAAALALILSGAAAGLVWAAAFGIGLSSAAWNGVVMLVLVRGHRAGGGLGRASGLVQGAFFLGMAVGPPVFGLLVDHAGGYTSGWWWVMGSFVAALATSLALSRRSDPTAVPAGRAPRAAGGPLVRTDEHPVRSQES